MKIFLSNMLDKVREKLFPAKGGYLPYGYQPREPICTLSPPSGGSGVSRFKDSMIQPFPLMIVSNTPENKELIKKIVDELNEEIQRKHEVRIQ